MPTIRDTIRDDPISRRVLQLSTIIITAVMAASGLFVLTAIFWPWFEGILPKSYEYIIDRILPFFQTMPGDLLSIFVTAGPAVVAGVCYRTQGAVNRLNLVGYICATIAIIGFFSSVIGIAVLKSGTGGIGQLGDEQSILDMAAAAETSARSSLFYLAIFFGIGGAKND